MDYHGNNDRVRLLEDNINRLRTAINEKNQGLGNYKLQAENPDGLSKFRDISQKIRDIEVKLNQLRAIESEYHGTTKKNDILIREKETLDTKILEKRSELTKLLKKHETIKNIITSNVAASEVKEQEINTYIGNLGDNADYDLSIIANAITSLANPGWKIRTFKQPPQIESIVISAVGNFNKGKSFLLRYLSGKSLPTGFHIHTDSLSFLFPEGTANPVTYIDTKGLELPLKRNRGGNPPGGVRESQERRGSDFPGGNPASLVSMENLIKDCRIAEVLIQTFVLEESDIILIVVGQLTFADQILIHRVRKQFQKNTTKKIYIIHNFFTLSTREEVEQAVENDITSVFDVEEQTIPALDQKAPAGSQNSVMYIDKRQRNIVHLIMARENSDSGRFYNNSVKIFLSLVTLQTASRRHFDPVASLTRYLTKTISEYITTDGDVKPQISVVQGPAGLEGRENGVQHKYQEQISFLRVQAAKIQPKPVRFDMLERIVNLQKKINYDVKVTAHELIMTIELPGMRESDMQSLVSGKCVKTSTGFFIEVEGKKVDDVQDVRMILDGNRSYGDFKVATKTIEFYKFDLEDYTRPERSNKNGLLVLVFPFRDPNRPPKQIAPPVNEPARVRPPQEIVQPKKKSNKSSCCNIF